MGNCLALRTAALVCPAPVTAKFDVFRMQPDLMQHRRQLEQLGLGEFELSLLMAVFRDIDKDKSNSIEIVELLEFLELDRTKFTKRVFAIFDIDGSGSIDFTEFTLTLWNYCSLSVPALVMFAFQLYDSDNSGEIEFHEVEIMMRDMYGDAYNENMHAQTIMRKLGKMNDRFGLLPRVTLVDFLKFTKRHPGLLFPAFNLQRTMQLKICGLDFWERCTTQRNILSEGRLLDIREFLKEQVTKEKFQRLCETDDDGDKEADVPEAPPQPDQTKRTRSQSSEVTLLSAMQKAAQQYGGGEHSGREESKEAPADNATSNSNSNNNSSSNPNPNPGPFKPLVLSSSYFEEQIDKMLAAEMSPSDKHKDVKPLVRKTSVPPGPVKRNSKLARANQHDTFARAAAQGYTGPRTSIAIQATTRV